MTWNEPSGLSPLCILCINGSAGIFIQCKEDLQRNAACLYSEKSYSHTCSTASGDGWVCQNKLYMEGLWTKAFSNWMEQKTKVLISDCTVTHSAKNCLFVFFPSHLVSGPLNRMLDDRRERLESAEWDLLLWGIPLKEDAYISKTVWTKAGIVRLAASSESSHTHMAIVGLCQIWHNDLCVSFGSHGAGVQEWPLIGYTSTGTHIHADAFHALTSTM